jgi:DNA-directed RNA polymerase subunit RPC12/RpoP
MGDLSYLECPCGYTKRLATGRGMRSVELHGAFCLTCDDVVEAVERDDVLWCQTCNGDALVPYPPEITWEWAHGLGQTVQIAGREAPTGSWLQRLLGASPPAVASTPLTAPVYRQVFLCPRCKHQRMRTRFAGSWD